MPFFEYNGTKIHYVDVDKREDKAVGKTILFVHGAGLTHVVWGLQLLEFSKTNRCIAIDLSNHGKSDKVEGDASIEHGYAHEIAGLVAHLELKDFILVGHSMGGGVSMSYVLHENFVSPKALVLVDTSTELDLQKVVPGLVMEAVEDISEFKHQAFEDYLEREHLEKYEAALKAVDPISMQRDLLACNKFDISDRVKFISIPTFGIVGEDDDVIPPSIMKEFLEKVPRADIAVVRGADHVPMIEQPDEFNRLFRKFVTWVEEKV